MPAPSRTVAYEVLGELMRGKGFGGSAKWRRSIATRPAGVYGRLRATRQGEYVLLDTNSLDVYAMEQVTHRWVKIELSVAMDLFTRCVLGIRLAPVSTTAVDVARLLYDVVRPQPASDHWPAGARWPYHGLAERGLFSEGLAGADAAMAQTARRWTRLGVDPFDVGTEEGRRTWRRLLLAVEQRLVLADAHRGMVADELSDYLFARSSGHIGSLITLITRGCCRAVRCGEEWLSTDLLDRVKNDEASERARRELTGALAAGTLTSRPTGRQAAKRGDAA